jgi:hypothetical protein
MKRCLRAVPCARASGTRRSARASLASGPTPSASLPTRDILFRPVAGGRNRAECRLSRSFFRTTSTEPEAHSGPLSAYPGPFSLTQPNHARFGTDVRRPPDQCFSGHPNGYGFEGRALRRGKPGSNHFVRYDRLTDPKTDRSLATHTSWLSSPGRRPRARGRGPPLPPGAATYTAIRTLVAVMAGTDTSKENGTASALR